MQTLLSLLDVALQLLEFAIADFCHLSIVAFTLGTIGVKLQLLDVHLVLLNLVEQGFLVLPLGFILTFLFLQFGQFLTDLFQFRLVVLALDGFTLYLELLDLTRDLIQFLWHGIDLHAKLSCSFIHQVDGLIRQETVADITVAQLHGSDDGIVLDTHMVMVLIALLQSTKDGNAVQRTWFIHHHGLESTFQGLILLEVLLVLIEGGGTNATQFATCQGRLQNIGSIHGAFTLTSTHQGVDLIDEEDDVSLGLLHLINDGLQTLLELTLVLGTSNQGTHIEGVHLLVLQVLWHISS